MNDNVLKWLEAWYKEQCDGDWEHEYGVKIDNVDNPGWSVKIDLTNTQFENLSIEKLIVDNDETDWCFIEIKNRSFDGVGDTGKLYFILETFRGIIENHRPASHK